MTGVPPTIDYAPPASSASDDLPTQAEETNAARYEEILADDKYQICILFAKLARSWVRDIMPDILAEIVKEFVYATHDEVYANANQQMAGIWNPSRPAPL